MTAAPIAGSFRDPAGSVFAREGIVYRQINEPGMADYERLMQSGLYDALVQRELLVAHQDLGTPPWAPPGARRVIRPTQCPMIAFPYEFCFSQLKDAALLTLDAQREALARGMCLKDASAFNVQFLDGRPTLIDTLSFEGDSPGPWKAYRQFCQHFYAPLALASHVDAGLGKLSQVFIDGVPLRVASRALPLRTWLRPGPLMHLHLHAVGEDRLARSTAPAGTTATRDVKRPLLASLEAAVRRLRWRTRSSWTGYYERRESYTAEAIEQKLELVAGWLDAARPAVVWDLGANTGRFRRLASERGILTVALDRDPACIENMYLDARKRNDRCLLPLVVDLTNPSAALGWAHEERASLVQRGPADVALALALVHHLALGNNVPLDRIAGFLKRVARQLFIEFVPATDPMATALMASRPGMFGDYTRDGFEAAFQREFHIERRVELSGSERVLYWMRAA